MWGSLKKLHRIRQELSKKESHVQIGKQPFAFCVAFLF